MNETSHPELSRALNNMKTILSRDHSEKDWKWAVCRMLEEMTKEIVKPEYVEARYVEPPRMGPARTS